MSVDIDKLKLSSPGLIPLWAWNALVDQVHASMITGFHGGGFSRSLLGTSIWARGGAEDAQVVPFDITDQTVAGAVTLTFWPGTINGIMPSNMFDPQTVDATSLWYVIATATTDGSAVTGIVLSASTTAPTPQTAATNAMPSTVAITVGIYKAGLAYNIAGKNITMTPVQINQAAGGFTGVWAIA